MVILIKMKPRVTTKMTAILTKIVRRPRGCHTITQFCCNIFSRPYYCNCTALQYLIREQTFIEEQTILP